MQIDLFSAIGRFVGGCTLKVRAGSYKPGENGWLGLSRVLSRPRSSSYGSIGDCAASTRQQGALIGVVSVDRANGKAAGVVRRAVGQVRTLESQVLSHGEHAP